MEKMLQTGMLFTFVYTGIRPFTRLPENRLFFKLAAHLLMTKVSAKTAINQASINCNLLFINPHAFLTTF